MKKKVRNLETQLETSIPQKNAFSFSHWIKSIWSDLEWPMVLLIGLGSLGLSTWGFYIHLLHAYPTQNITVWDSLIRALMLYSLNSGDFEPVAGFAVPWQLQIGRFLSPAVAAYAFLQLILGIFRTQVQLFRLRAFGNHIVICGLGRKGLLLARQYRNQNDNVVVIEKESQNPLIEACRESGAIVLVGDTRDPLILRKAGIANARHLIAVCGDDGTNAEIALQALEMSASRQEELICTVHIYNNLLWSLLMSRELNAEVRRGFRLELFNVFESGARLMLKESSPIILDSAPTDCQPHLLVMGLGYLGESLIVQAARIWRLNNKKSTRLLPMTVIDPAADIKIKTLHLRYPLLKKSCTFETLTMDTNSPEFQQARFLSDSHGKCKITHAYICLDDVTSGLNTGLSLLDHAQGSKLQIFVRMSEDSGLASLVQGVKGRGKSGLDLHSFRLLNRTCVPEIIEGGTYNTLARVIHEAYCDNMEKDGIGQDPIRYPAYVPWEQLRPYYRRSNRRQAEHIGFKLRKIGYGIAPWTDEEADEFEFSDEELEIMGQMEHTRWCTDKLSQGYHYGDKRDEIQRHHPDLLSWEQLPEKVKKKNREEVRLIPLYLARAGFQVRRQ